MSQRAARFVQSSLRTSYQNATRSSKAFSKSIISDIHRASSGKDIVSALQSAEQSPRTITNASIYHKAMDKCKSLRDWQSIPEIMNLLLSQTHFSLTVDSLNHFISTIIHSNTAPESLKYFNHMVTERGIIPNLETFIGIFNSFDSPKTIGNIEKYWNLMRNEYHLEPPPSLYAQIMKQYSTADHKEKSIEIFNEYLERVQRGQLPVDRLTFSTYLHTFAFYGDIEGMNNALDILKEHNIDCNHRHIITVIATGYHKAREHRKCIALCDEWIQNGNVPDSNMMRIRCSALCGILRDEKELKFSQRHKIYRRIERLIHCELKECGLEITPMIASRYLIAAILLFHDQNPMEIIKLYEDLERRNLLKQYISSEFGTFSGFKEINVHFAEILEAQFVIRYLFGYRMKELMDNGDDECIWILVGKGKHSKGIGRNQGKMRQFVIKELSEWNPPLECKPHPYNHGLLSVDKRQCEPYLVRMNSVKRMLLNPSTRWNVHDSRWMDIVERTLKESESAEEIVSVMKSYGNVIEYPRFYVNAMKKCGTLKDVGAVQYVMQLFMESEHDLTVEHFNVFFEIMMNLGVAEVNKDYLESMVRRFGITPDLSTYSIITQSLRTISGSMIKKQRLEMMTILKEHFGDVEEVSRGKVEPQLTVEGEETSDIAENDDDDHLENIFECIRPRKGLNLHQALVVDLMKGYLVNGDNHIVIDIFDFCVREDIDRTVDDQMIKLKKMADGALSIPERNYVRE